MLTACGGGGGDGGSETATAEGIWGGTTSTGEVTGLIVLPGGDTWGVYGDEASGEAGILQGNVLTIGSVVSGSLLDFNLAGPGQTNVGISGSVSTRNDLRLVLASSATLNLAYDASYDTPANLAAMSGTYGALAIGRGNIDGNLRLVINGSAITTSSSSAPGCTGSGSLSIRPGGKAILNFTMSFQGTGCLVTPNTTISGIAQYVTGEIVAIGLDSGRTQGLVIYGER